MCNELQHGVESLHATGPPSRGLCTMGLVADSHTILCHAHSRAGGGNGGDDRRAHRLANARRQASHGGLTRRQQRHHHHRRRQPAHSQSRFDCRQRQRHRRHRHAGEHRGALPGGRYHRRDREGGDARLDQHPHPCGHGDVSRARQRSRADGLAAEVHLPGRGENGVAGVRARRARASRCSR